MSSRLLPALVLLAFAAPTSATPEANITAAGTDGLDFRLRPGPLQTEKVTIAGRRWTALTLPEGVTEGQPGRPALPVWTTLIVIPDGAELSATATASDERRLAGIDLAPRQADDSEQPVVDTAWYDGGRRTESELVAVGRPARLGGITVAPVVVRPVSYDAATRTATIADQVDISLKWNGGRTGTPPLVTATVAGILAGAALNWPPTARDGADTGGDALGTWVAIVPADPSLRTILEPLVDWRRRQGYNVIVADLDQTGPVNTQIKAYLQNLYDTVDPPLEFVTLVGDGNGSVAVPTWRETVSGQYGEGDHPYTLLAGADQLPDIQVGRLSCLNSSQLAGIVAKIVAYETDPERDDPAWFTRGAVVGDPEDSGTSTVHCAKWLADQLYLVGFERVYTIFSGNFTDLMFDTIQAGRTVFGYRGFYGMSGFNPGHAAALTNGGRLPFAAFPTCDTGSFLLDTTCRSEAFIQNPNGGAIGAIGTATVGTHTRYNNCFFYGLFEGLLHGADHRQGVAHSRSKLELFRQYGVNEPDVTEIWSTWNTLMGDPATDIWLSVPRDLDVAYPATIPAAATAIPVTVLADGEPLAGARVAAVQGDQWRSVAVTGDSGEVLLPLAGCGAGTMQITVSGHDLLPHQGTILVSDQEHWVALESFTVGGDGLVSPAAEVTIDLTLRNLGQQTASGVTAELTSESSWLQVIEATSQFGTIAAGATATGQTPMRVAVAADTPAGAACRLRTTVTADSGAWISQFALDVTGSDLREAGLVFTAGDLEPGTSSELAVTVENVGALPVAGAQAVLRSRSLWVAITDSTGTFGAIPTGGQADNAADPFAMTFAADMVRGASVPLTLVLDEAGGARRRIDLNIPVGERTVTDPTGADAYGYYAFDNGDTGYAETHPFDWVEIDPTRGGAGLDVGLDDRSYEMDDTEIVTLPFTFRYYGRQYDTLSICSNGWVAFGETNLVNWRNWGIPSAGSPDAMVAVFWDDLRQVGDDKVYHWYDEAGHRYLVQWSRMPNLNGGIQTCQIILHDPEYYPTLSQDGIIVCQYLDLDDNDFERNFATLGVQSPDGRDGVCYSYYNVASPGAVVPHAGLAITYVPKGRREPVTCDVSPTAFDVVLAVGGQQTHALDIANNGAPGTPLVYDIIQVDPAVDPTIGRAPGKDMTGCTVTVTEAGYLPGEPLEVHLALYNGSADDEWIESFRVALPPGVTLLGGTDLFDGQYSLFWQDGGGDDDAYWLGSGADMIHPGDTAAGTFTIEVDYGLGDLGLDWFLTGDVYGSPPHDLAGSFELAALGNLLNILDPDGGEVWSLGETRAIGWEYSDDVVNLSVELSRDSGASWETLAASVPAADGSLDWLVTGPVSDRCRVRLTSTTNPLVTDLSSGDFLIQNDLSWLVLDSQSGEVATGDTAHHLLTFDATGLAAGSYEQVLTIVNNAGPDVTVPVTMLVTGNTGSQNAPTVTTLAQNHPNPFNPGTRITFALAHAGPVDLAIYDLAGRRVAQLVRGEQAVGRHTVYWDGGDGGGRGLPSGTYVYRLVADGAVMSRKLTLIK